MTVTDVKHADAALARLCAMRAAIKREAFYAQCDRLLDIRLAAALVTKLETEHAELALVGERGPELVNLPPRRRAR